VRHESRHLQLVPDGPAEHVWEPLDDDDPTFVQPNVPHRSRAQATNPRLTRVAEPAQEQGSSSDLLPSQ